MVPTGRLAASRRRLSDTERLTAVWIGLAAVLLAARFWILRLAEHVTGGGNPVLLPWFPLAAYQDVCCVVAFAAAAAGLLRRLEHPLWRGLVRTGAWTVGLVAALYAAMSAQIFGFLNTPLTYRLIAMSDRLRGIRSSIDAVVTRERLSTLIAAPFAMCVVALLLIACAPRIA